MSVSAKCKVCSGHVRPVDDRSIFGYCEKCGLVYALKDRLADREAGGARRGEEPAQGRGLRWRCPDCDSEMEATSEADLEFIKREHVREFHPNRTMG